MIDSEKHKGHYLTYAINADGKLVHIDDVPNGTKCNCICPSCKAPLIAKNKGNKEIERGKMHHFAHQSGYNCTSAYETMLHLLAKEKIREAFLERDEFWIEFEYKSYCCNNEKCDFIRDSECYTTKRKRYNLKDYYDSCEQEIKYDGINLRSDLKIYSSTDTNRKPIYLEFCVTHASEQYKLHSGNKIIEIVIDSEKDIYSIFEEGIIERSNISFYGFKNEDFCNINICRNIYIVRYILYQSGKFDYSRNECTCKELKPTKNNSLFEIYFNIISNWDVYNYVKYLGYAKYLIKNCLVCKYYRESYDGGRICILYKKIQIPKYEKFDTTRAKTCHKFFLNYEEMEKELKEGEKFKYTILHETPTDSNCNIKEYEKQIQYYREKQRRIDEYSKKQEEKYNKMQNQENKEECLNLSSEFNCESRIKQNNNFTKPLTEEGNILERSCLACEKNLSWGNHNEMVRCGISEISRNGLVNHDFAKTCKWFKRKQEGAF